MDLNQQELDRINFILLCAEGNLDEVKRRLSIDNSWLSFECFYIDGDKEFTGITPLTVSALKGHIPIVNFLLEKGADVNEVDTV